jgi:hypothetical protein
MANDFYTRYVAITPSNTINFDGTTYSANAVTKAIPAIGIYVGGAGIAVVIDESGNAVNFTAVAGEILPLKCIRVNSTTTTATLMVALYE